MQFSHILYRKAIRDLKKKAEELIPAAKELGYATSLQRILNEINLAIVEDRIPRNKE